VVTVIASFLVLHERVTLVQVTGMSLIIASLYILSGNNTRKAQQD